MKWHVETEESQRYKAQCMRTEEGRAHYAELVAKWEAQDRRYTWQTFAVVVAFCLVIYLISLL